MPKVKRARTTMVALDELNTRMQDVWERQVVDMTLFPLLLPIIGPLTTSLGLTSEANQALLPGIMTLASFCMMFSHVRPHENNHVWVEPTILNFGVINYSGAKKTPVFRLLQKNFLEACKSTLSDAGIQDPFLRGDSLEKLGTHGKTS